MLLAQKSGLPYAAWKFMFTLRRKTMAKGKLFEYAVLYHPKTKKDAAGNEMETKKSILVIAPTQILASNDKEVGMIAARGLADEYLDKLEDVEILIRPF